jgi:hypothetical protein
MMAMPLALAAARYSPLSMTFWCEQVSPDRYQRTGTGLSSACGGRKIAKVIGQAQALL